MRVNVAAKILRNGRRRGNGAVGLDRQPDECGCCGRRGGRSGVGDDEDDEGEHRHREPLQRRGTHNIRNQTLRHGLSAESEAYSRKEGPIRVAVRTGPRWKNRQPGAEARAAGVPRTSPREASKAEMARVKHM